MKKTIFVIALFISSCGGSETTKENVEATYADTPKADSSVILPALTDSAKADTLTAQ